MAIDSASKPILFAHDNIPWPLMLTSNVPAVSNKDTTSKTSEGDKNTLSSKLDPCLAVIWAAMSEFCDLINAAAENGEAKITEDAFLHSMGSIMYRLVFQHFELGSLNEAFRLGLLTFASPIFLHWNRVELPDPRFTSAFRTALAGLELADHNVESPEYLWLLMVAAVSMSHEPDHVVWLRPRIQIHSDLGGVFTWDAMRDLLSSFLWVGLIYDKPGHDIFDLMLAL
jgi:hypothetical protein